MTDKQMQWLGVGLWIGALIGVSVGLGVLLQASVPGGIVLIALGAGALLGLIALGRHRRRITAP